MISVLQHIWDIYGTVWKEHVYLITLDGLFLWVPIVVDFRKIKHSCCSKFVAISFSIIWKIAFSLALEFLGGTLHENHENWYPIKIKRSTEWYLHLQGLFGDDDDNETSMYFPQSTLFRPDKEVRITLVCSQVLPYRVLLRGYKNPAAVQSVCFNLPTWLGLVDWILCK